MAYYVGPVGDLQGVAHIMVCYKNSDILGGKAFDYSFNFGYCNWVDAGERLVQKQELRLHGKGPGNLGPPPLSAGESKGFLLAYMSDSELLYKLL